MTTTTGAPVTIYLTAEALKIYKALPKRERSQAIAAALVATYGDGPEAAKAKIQALLIQAK